MKQPFMLLLICSLFFIDSCSKTVIDTVAVAPVLVWNKAPHNAFTDLIKFNGNYYCVFREGKQHLSYDGKLRILRSMDGKKWDDFSLLSIEDRDIRDGHFVVDEHNVLSIISSIRDKNDIRTNVIYKLKNNNFIKTDVVVDKDYWLWSFNKWKGKLYTLGYNTSQPCYNSFASSQKSKLMLFSNSDSDCINFGKVELEKWLDNDFKCPSEASMLVTPDSTLVAIVRDEQTLNQSHIGYAKYPFNNWHWQRFPYFIRGPKIALLPNGKIFLCAASMVRFDKTYYAIINPENFSTETIKAFPSGGDTGYPGVIIEGNTALISYYSSHEGNSRVYIDKISY